MKAPIDLAGVAQCILSGECQSIVILSGAGVSVSSGIPDFRSPGGMYDTLKPDLITATPAQRQLMRRDPTHVVEKNMFLQNQFPYLEVRRPFILGTRDGRWKATLAHRFAELLHLRTGKLTRVYTQNIDGLDRQTSIPPEKILAVHGTISEAACEICEAEVDFEEFCEEVKSRVKDIYGVDEEAPKESTPILCKSCGNPTVKSRTVLFGGSMPLEFFRRVPEDLPKVDLLIIAGTSLVVAPANGIVFGVPDDAIRVVVNKEEVGSELGIDYSDNAERDFFAKGSCDEVFLDLVCQLGWLDDLQKVLHELPRESAKLVMDRIHHMS